MSLLFKAIKIPMLQYMYYFDTWPLSLEVRNAH